MTAHYTREEHDAAAAEMVAAYLARYGAPIAGHPPTCDHRDRARCVRCGLCPWCCDMTMCEGP